MAAAPQHPAESQRYLRRMADSQQTLDRLEAAHPDYGRLFQERGHCRRALGDAEAAGRRNFEPWLGALKTMLSPLMVSPACKTT